MQLFLIQKCLQLQSVLIIAFGSWFVLCFIYIYGLKKRKKSMVQCTMSKIFISKSNTNTNTTQRKKKSKSKLMRRRRHGEEKN